MSMPPRRTAAQSRAAAAGPSTSGRNHGLAAEVKAGLDAFVELVPRLLRLPGLNGLPVERASASLTARLVEAFRRLDWQDYGTDGCLAALRYSRVAELGVLLLRGDVTDAASPAQRDALVEAQFCFSLLLDKVTTMRDVEECMTQAVPIYRGLVRSIGRTGVLHCMARQLAAAAGQLRTADGIRDGVETYWRACTVLQFFISGVCICPELAAGAEATLAGSHVMQHAGILAVKLLSLAKAGRLSKNLLVTFGRGRDYFCGACARLADRRGSKDASRRLLGGGPLLATLTLSVAVMHDLDGDTAYGLPAELRCSAAQLCLLSGACASLAFDPLVALCSPAAVLAHGPVPLHGISRRGVLAVMLRIGGLVVASAGAGRILCPDGCSYALDSHNTRSCAVLTLCAAVQLLLPADVAKEWVREGCVAVWRLAADMARAGALRATSMDGCTPSCFGAVYALVEAELCAGGWAMLKRPDCVSEAGFC